MSINAEEILARMDLQQLRSFILDGLDSMEVYDCSYEERLKKGDELIINRLRNIYKDNKEFSDAVDDFYHAQVINSEVFTEIGLKAGARFLIQLLYDDKQL